MNILGVQTTIRKLVADYNFYLEYIGLFENENEEITSVSSQGYDFSYDNNFVNVVKTLAKTNQKMLMKDNKLGDLQSVFGSYKSNSYYCAFVDSIYLLIVLKQDFNNLAFLQEIVAEIKKKIRGK